MRERPRYAFLALLFLGAFWVFAAAADWFLDTPFVYTVPDEWSQNLVKAVARGLGREESALFIAALFTTLPALLLLALLLSGRARAPLRALQQRASHAGLRFVGLLAALSMLLSLVGSKLVLRSVALIDDERSYLFGAQNLVAGTLFRARAPAAFRNPMVLTAPHWISKYPPGFAALLSPGVWLGCPRLVPTLVCGLSVWGVFELAKLLFGWRTALLASLLWALSPFHLAISSTTMIFGTSGCLALWAGALTARGTLRREPRALVGAAVLVAAQTLVRPFDAALTLGTLGIALLAFGPPPVALRRSILLGAGFALGALGLAAFNQRVFGSPFASGYTSAGDYRFGFFVQSLPGFDYVHTPLQALANMIVAFVRLDGWLVGVPGVLALALLTLPRPNRREQALLLAIVLHLLAYSLGVSSGTFDVGPTYYYLVAPCYLLLAVRGGVRLQLALARKQRRLVTWASVLVIPIAWLTVVPLKVVRLAALSEAIGAPWDYLAASTLESGLVVLPPFKALHAAGYGLGYPYEIRTRAGSLTLIRPETQRELAQALRYLHYSGPVFALEFDEVAFQVDGRRQYRLHKLEISY